MLVGQRQGCPSLRIFSSFGNGGSSVDIPEEAEACIVPATRFGGFTSGGLEEPEDLPTWRIIPG